MFDHVKFGASDYVGGKIFFLKALEPLGIPAGFSMPSILRYRSIWSWH